MQYPVCWEAWDRHNSEYRQLCGTARLLLAGGDSCLRTYHVLAPPPRVHTPMFVHMCGGQCPMSGVLPQLLSTLLF